MPPTPVDAEIAQAHVEVAFYAPPPRPDAGELAIVSTRTGSAEDLAAEILATKKRLSERSAAFFAEPVSVALPAEPEKPGFYRKPKAIAAQPSLSSAREPAPASLAEAHADDHADVDHVDTVAVPGNRPAIKMRINSSREETPLAATNDLVHDGRHDR